jgi:hypothetical protein
MQSIVPLYGNCREGAEARVAIKYFLATIDSGINVN